MKGTRRAFVRSVGAAALVGTGGVVAAGGAQEARDSGVVRRTVVAGPAGAPYSRSVKLDHMVFVSGVLAHKPGTRELISEEFEPQARQALENLKASVEAAGSSLEKVLKCTVFLTEASDFATWNKVYVEFFPKDPPARSTVVVKELVAPGCKVEVDCVTYVE